MRTRKRGVLAWQPQWNESIEKWTRFKIKENHWRFDPIIDSQEDLLHEAQILFWQLQKTYLVIENMGHFFALYKTSLLRRFTDKSRSKKRRELESISLDQLPEGTEPEGNLQNCGYLSLLLNEMPDELKLVLSTLTTGRVKVSLDRPTSIKRVRENANMRVRRRCPSLSLIDPIGDLKRVLKYNS